MRRTSLNLSRSLLMQKISLLSSPLSFASLPITKSYLSCAAEVEYVTLKVQLFWDCIPCERCLRRINIPLVEKELKDTPINFKHVRNTHVSLLYLLIYIVLYTCIFCYYFGNFNFSNQTTYLWCSYQTELKQWMKNQKLASLELANDVGTCPYSRREKF